MSKFSFLNFKMDEWFQLGAYLWIVLSPQISCTATPNFPVVPLTSSGTALILTKPFLKTTNTRRAPQRKADVAQSKAVSPAPSTITAPRIDGNGEWQAHIPEWWKENPIFKERKPFLHDSSKDTCTQSSVKLYLAVLQDGVSLSNYSASLKGSFIPIFKICS